MAKSRRGPRRDQSNKGPRQDQSNGPPGQELDVGGILDMSDDSTGFLRDPRRNYAQQPGDPFVPVGLIKKLHLRQGFDIKGRAVTQQKNKGPRLNTVELVNDAPVATIADLPVFEEQTVVNPNERFRFETPNGPPSMRVVDLLTPIGKGQRGLIVAAPRTGKTILLQELAGGVAVNHPEVYTIVLLIDERPEEVTEMRRSVHGEVIASSNDMSTKAHIRVAKLAVERAKRLVECGRDVLILLDSITRMGRAFNAAIGSSGRTMTGGVDIRAMEWPKRLFGAARKIENGGSLTIIASALVQTGSRMDDYIFQEFKGTGNMELVLDRGLADFRIWPAMNVPESGTRREELLVDEGALRKITRLRQQLVSIREPRVAMEMLLKRLELTADNAALLAAMPD